MTFLATIFIIGLSGIVAQIIVLRELLVNFYGNELTIGVILANWVLLEALGVFIAGRVIERVKNKLNVFIALNILFSLILPFSVYLARVFKGVIGIPFSEAVSLSTIFISSLAVNLPFAFLHGALFSSGCKVYSLMPGKREDAIGKIYTWEMLGTISGGIILAYLFIPRLNSFQTVLIISFLNLALAALFIPAQKIRYVSLGLVALLFILFVNPLANYLQESSIKKQWGAQEVLEYRNSHYANICVTRKMQQYTFFYNGIPVITTPFPDRQFTEEFGNLPLLFHEAPADLLVAGSGIGGLIRQALKYPIVRLDYVEIDPLLIRMLKKYPTPLSEAEFGDRRLNIIHTDPRLFLKTSARHYDVILIGLSSQADLSFNRFFTQEFFALTQKRLKPGGLIALWMPGSLTYMSRELRDLNSSVFNSLKAVYKYVRVIPGDYNIFIASDSNRITQVNASLISERLTKEHIPVGLLIPAYLEYRLSQKWVNWFNRELEPATQELNRDLRPVAVYENLKITNNKFSPRFSRVFNYFHHLNLKLISLAVLLVTLALIFRRKSRRNLKIPVSYAIFTTGFFGMTASLLLIFAYQVFYGYLYQKISLLTAVFMAGIAAGSILITLNLKQIKHKRRRLINLEALIAVFSLVLGLVIAGFGAGAGPGIPIFYILLFIPGLLMGLEFPLAGKIYLAEQDSAGSASGILYASDLIGGWLAGVSAGVVFLPILGFFNTCLLLLILKLSSLLVLMLQGRDGSMLNGHKE
ncbi:MAG: spermine synthase [Candidatus Omnitrophica bacterium]|nr:spermine synthase [Candidatus Omnitrophota bacterium]